MNIHHSILTAIAATILIAGCVKEDPAYKKGTEPGPDAGTTGYLTLNAAALHVILDTATEPHPDKASAHTAQPATRTGNTPVALDDYLLTLSDKNGAEIYDGTYA